MPSGALPACLAFLLWGCGPREIVKSTRGTCWSWFCSGWYNPLGQSCHRSHFTWKFEDNECKLSLPMRCSAWTITQVFFSNGITTTNIPQNPRWLHGLSLVKPGFHWQVYPEQLVEGNEAIPIEAVSCSAGVCSRTPSAMNVCGAAWHYHVSSCLLFILAGM